MELDADHRLPLRQINRIIISSRSYLLSTSEWQEGKGEGETDA